MGNLGMPEIMMILVIALIIFGPRKLPEIGKTLGQSLAHFRKASEDFKRQWEEEVEIEKRKIDAAPATEVSHYSAATAQEGNDKWQPHVEPPVELNAEHGATPAGDPHPATSHDVGQNEIYAPVPTVETASATVPRSDTGARETKRDWL